MASGLQDSSLLITSSATVLALPKRVPRGLAALIRWIEVLIENRWAIPPPIDVVDQECALVIEPAMARRIHAHNEVCPRIRRLGNRPGSGASVEPLRQLSPKGGPERARVRRPRT